jgi:hypothetical protein
MRARRQEATAEEPEQEGAATRAGEGESASCADLDKETSHGRRSCPRRLRGPTSAGSIRCRTVGGLEATVNGDGSAGVPGVGAKEKSSPAREGREAVAPPLG